MKKTNAYYLLVVYGGVEIHKLGPFSSWKARDRRAIEVHKNTDVLDSLFWMDRSGTRIRVGSFAAATFEAEENKHAQGS
jgi:hypothetical protein